MKRRWFQYSLNMLLTETLLLGTLLLMSFSNPTQKLSKWWRADGIRLANHSIL